MRASTILSILCLASCACAGPGTDLLSREYAELAPLLRENSAPSRERFLPVVSGGLQKQVAELEAEATADEGAGGDDE